MDSVEGVGTNGDTSSRPDGIKVLGAVLRYGLCLFYMCEGAMLLICYISDRSPDWYAVVGVCHSLKEAQEKRKVSGDLVFNMDGSIVSDVGWLWDWELKKCSPKSYAERAIDSKTKIVVKEDKIREFYCNALL